MTSIICVVGMVPLEQVEHTDGQEVYFAVEQLGLDVNNLTGACQADTGE